MNGCTPFNPNSNLTSPELRQSILNQQIHDFSKVTSEEIKDFVYDKCLSLYYKFQQRADIIDLENHP